VRDERVYARHLRLSALAFSDWFTFRTYMFGRLIHSILIFLLLYIGIVFLCVCIYMCDSFISYGVAREIISGAARKPLALQLIHYCLFQHTRVFRSFVIRSRCIRLGTRDIRVDVIVFQSY